jgi:hypothetical protein
MNSGFHESYNAEGTLRGLIIWNCCPYAVIEKDNGDLVAFGFEDVPKELATIELE